MSESPKLKWQKDGEDDMLAWSNCHRWIYSISKCKDKTFRLGLIRIGGDSSKFNTKPMFFKTVEEAQEQAIKHHLDTLSHGAQ